METLADGGPPFVVVELVVNPPSGLPWSVWGPRGVGVQVRDWHWAAFAYRDEAEGYALSHNDKRG